MSTAIELRGLLLECIEREYYKGQMDFVRKALGIKT